jgi:hypothetical protein
MLFVENDAIYNIPNNQKCDEYSADKYLAGVRFVKPGGNVVITKCRTVDHARPTAGEVTHHRLAITLKQLRITNKHACQSSI